MKFKDHLYLTMSGRGFESRITTDNDMMFGDSSCVSCGACAHTCPTDAISDVFQSKSVAVDKKFEQLVHIVVLVVI